MFEIKTGVADVVVTHVEISRERGGLEGFPLYIALKLPAMQAFKVSVGLVADVILGINQPSDAIIKVLIGRSQLS